MNLEDFMYGNIKKNHENPTTAIITEKNRVLQYVSNYSGRLKEKTKFFWEPKIENKINWEERK